jgi:hypothetical protein
LGNISSNCFIRDTIIETGGLANLAEIIKTTKDEMLVKDSCWALNVLCKDNHNYDQIKDAIFTLGTTMI